MAPLAPGAAARALAAAALCLLVGPSLAARQARRGDPAASSSIGHVFDRVRFAAVRIEAITSEVDWFRPYRLGEEWASTGSGFAVSFSGLKEVPHQYTVGSDADMRLEVAMAMSEESPVFLTNAHVVRNAHRVNVQMPALGQEKFQAYVPVICEDFDIALVRLKEPKKFQKALSAYNASVRPFDIQLNSSGIVHMGLGVVSVGFPLGSSTLKLGTGIISGTEETSTRTRGIICYQSTAPISPGSSGGPLLAVDSSGDYQVIGINYASAASSKAQNTNYVLPAVHIFPVLHEFVERESSEGGPGEHVQLRFAPIGATLIESTDAIYNASGGCTSGPFISKISSRSVLALAEPPIPEKVQLVAVDGVQLDKFGMGRTPGFSGHPVPFGSILTARADLNKTQSVTICQNGKESTHVVSMRWRPEYDLGVREVVEPYYEKTLLDYEVFAGVTLMRMTLNHVYTLINDCAKWGTCTLGRWMMERNQLKPHVMVVHVDQGAYAYGVVAEGMTVSSVNGYDVSTLEDVRKHFVPKGTTWSLATDRGIVLTVKFEETLAAQLFNAWSSPSNRYLLTPAIKGAVEGSPTLKDLVGSASAPHSPGPPGAHATMGQNASGAGVGAAARAAASSGGGSPWRGLRPRPGSLPV